MSNQETRIIFTVIAPAEGDGPEDAAWWYFRTYAEALEFANDGWGADYGISNYHWGPFQVTKREVTLEKYRKIKFTKMVVP